MFRLIPRLFQSGKLSKASYLHRLATIHACARINNRRRFLKFSANQNNYFSTDSSTDSSQQSNESQEENIPIPHFKNILDHLKHLAPIYSSDLAENDEFRLLLDRLAADEKLGERLNFTLKQRINFQSNWLLEQSGTRSKKEKLVNRRPLPVWQNAAIMYPNATQMKTYSAEFIFEFISVILMGILNYRSKLAANSPEQFRQLFGSTRRPGPQIDIQKYHDQRTSTSYSFVLARKSNFFLLELDDKMEQGKLFMILKRVVDFVLNNKNAEEIPIGILSTLPRRDAAYGYQILNEHGLKRLEEAEFIVNLDKIDDSNEAVTNYDAKCKEILISSRENIGSRWFDKSFQLILQMNEKMDKIPTSGICFETSLVQAETIIEMLTFGLEYLIKFQPNLANSISDKDKEGILIKLHKLGLIIPEKKEMIASATNNFAMKRYTELAESFHLKTFEFTDYGRSFIESINCQSDTWIQVALGLAYYNLKQLRKNNIPTNGFSFKGLTSEMVDFFEDSKSEAKLRIALESLNFYQQLNQRGYNIDNILRVYLELIGRDASFDENQKEMLGSLFNHSIMQKINRPVISMKAAQSQSIYEGLIELIGPQVDGGFGCCYQVQSNEEIVFAITHHYEPDENADKKVDGEEVLREFCDFVRQALTQMKSIIEN